MIWQLPALALVLFQPILSYHTPVVPANCPGAFATDECKALTVTTVTATVYHADPRQCDADYTTTADGSKIDTLNPSKHRWIAVSRDMLAKNGGWLQFGDSLRIAGTNSHLDGIHIVRDVMNKRYNNTIDFLVSKNDIYGKWEEVRVEKI